MPIERLVCLVLGGAIVVRVLAIGMPPPLAAAPWDRLAHAALFALACALCLVGTRGRAAFAVAAALAAAGALDELQQAFRPGGHADALDFVADACGAFAAATLMSQKNGKDRLCAESSEL